MATGKTAERRRRGDEADRARDDLPEGEGRDAPTPQPTRANDADSGDVEVFLATRGPDSRATSMTIRVTGTTFQGALRNLKGARVTASPVAYDSQGVAQTAPLSGAAAFIIDFGAVISILELRSAAQAIKLVLPWLGTEFSSKPLHPVPASAGPFAPKPDTQGKVKVALPGVETSKLLVQVASGGTVPTADAFAEACEITTDTPPRNVRASLSGRPPFWTRPGALTETVELTGALDDLNTLLAEASEPTDVHLLLATDAPGVLNVEIPVDLTFERLADGRWGGQGALDVQLPALEAQPIAVSFPQAQGAGTDAWLVHGLTLELAGKFPSWRAYPGQASGGPGKLGVRVDARFAVARRIVLDQRSEIFGFAILLRPSENETQLRVELFAEDAGEPGSGKPLAAVDLSLYAETGVAPRWQDVLFAQPVLAEGPTRLWLVAKAKAGAREWTATAEAPAVPTTTLFSHEGGRWEPYPLLDGKSPVAEVRVLRRPYPNENAPLLDVIWTAGDLEVTRSIDISEDATALDVPLPAGHPFHVAPANGAVAVPITVLSRAGGTLFIRRATAFYEERGS